MSPEELSYDSSEPITLDNLIGDIKTNEKSMILSKTNKEKKVVIFFLIFIMILLIIPYFVNIFNQLSKNGHTQDI